ncbi:MAG: DUF695 domain-containing protein [Chitinophagia bacterium]|nr:DUF695 domain-containing protein [Chitinophagia bacterium]
MTSIQTRSFALLVFLAPVLLSTAQVYESDWDAYLMQVEGRPVSVVVDLGLRRAAPMANKPFATLIRTRLLRPQANGLPGSEESARLDSLEERLVERLEKGRGDIYAGRFTHRGIRTFHFFTGDTSGQATALHAAFAGFPEYAWLARSVADSAWSNYLDALYPPPRELELIHDRRLVDRLQRQGDPLARPRPVEHYLRFPSKISRMEFLRQPGMEAFTVAEMPEADSTRKDMPYLLHLRRVDIPDMQFIDRVVIPLRDKASRMRGRYEGWETYLVE